MVAIAACGVGRRAGQDGKRAHCIVEVVPTMTAMTEDATHWVAEVALKFRQSDCNDEVQKNKSLKFNTL